MNKMKENNNVFLVKISEKIKQGDFDSYLTIPFMTRELLLLTIKSKFNKRVETGGTPILSDHEIQDCILQVKETAAITCALFEKFGFLQRTSEGYKLSKKGEMVLKIRKC